MSAYFTHTVRAAVHLELIPETTPTDFILPSLPPSIFDVSQVAENPLVYTILQNTFQGITAPEKNIIQGVRDPHGIWYYRKLTDDEILPALQKVSPELATAHAETLPILDNITKQIENGLLEQLFSDHPHTWGAHKEIFSSLPDAYTKANLLFAQLLAEHMTGGTTLQDVTGMNANQTAELQQRSLELVATLTQKQQAFLTTLNRYIHISQDPSKQAEAVELRAQILEEYALFGNKVRYVPTADIPHEPPCAGPSYKNSE